MGCSVLVRIYAVFLCIVYNIHSTTLLSYSGFLTLTSVQCAYVFLWDYFLLLTEKTKETCRESRKVVVGVDILLEIERETEKRGVFNCMYAREALRTLCLSYEEQHHKSWQIRDTRQTSPREKKGVISRQFCICMNSNPIYIATRSIS